MDSCQKCSRVFDIYDHGIIELQSIQPIITAIKGRLSILNIPYESNEIQVNFKYSTIENLILFLEEIEELLNIETKNKLLCQAKSLKTHNDSVTITFSELFERVKNRNLLSVINDQLFTSFLQPVVSLETLGVYGYEFLLRPEGENITFNPGELFSFSKRAGLQSLLDSQARFSSIRTSSKLLQKGMKRFINFVPSSIYDPNHCLKSTFSAVEKYEVDPEDLIFEVVETEKIKDIEHLKNIFDVYKKHGMKVALDDLGAGYATLEVLKELRPNFAKIDRSMIDFCDKDADKQRQINNIVQIANDYNIVLLAEGIERKEEAQFCNSIGIPLAQGYFFAQPAPVPLSESKLTNIKL